MCGQHNVKASAGDITGQNTDKGHTPNPRIGIKIPDPPEIEPGTPGWKAGTVPTTPRRRIALKINTLNFYITSLCLYGIRVETNTFCSHCIWVLGNVYIKGHWGPYQMTFDDYDGQ